MVTNNIVLIILLRKHLFNMRGILIALVVKIIQNIFLNNDNKEGMVSVKKIPISSSYISIIYSNTFH